jgi:hypothetical protein
VKRIIVTESEKKTIKSLYLNENDTPEEKLGRAQACGHQSWDEYVSKSFSCDTSKFDPAKGGWTFQDNKLIYLQPEVKVDSNKTSVTPSTTTKGSFSYTKEGEELQDILINTYKKNITKDGMVGPETINALLQIFDQYRKK